MSTIVSVEPTGQGQLRISLRQGKGEVAVFAGAVVGVIGALLAFLPESQTYWTVLFALVGAAIAWSAVALSAVETYAFDRERGTVTYLRTSWLGRSTLRVPAKDVHEVQRVVRGPDDDRLVIELVSRQGHLQLRIPRRFNTLSHADQQRLGSAIARHLEVPLRADG